MPKQQLLINKFEGGLHTDADPRDIADNEFSSLKSISVSSMGLLKCMGASATDTNISGLNTNSSTGAVDMTYAMNAGYGLFPFNSDYTTNGEQSPQNYLALQDGDTVRIFGNGAWNENNFSGPLIDLNVGATAHTTDVKPSYYAINGDLRICDGNFGNEANVPTYAGIAGKKVLAEKDISGTDNDYGGNVTIGSSWISQEAGIEANPFDNEGTSAQTTSPDANLVMHNGGVDGDDATLTEMTDRRLTFFGTDENRYSQATWGLGLSFDEDRTGTSPYSGKTGGGTWQPNSSVAYRFYATVLYDKKGENIWQESHPKPFLMFGTQRDSSDDGLEATDEIKFKYGTFADTHSASSTGLNQLVFFSPHLRINGSATGTDGNYAFGNSSITANGSSSGQKGNERISGCRIYWSSNEDAHSNLYLLWDLDFVKGAKPFGMGLVGATAGEYHPWNVYSTSGTDTDKFTLYITDTGTNRFLDPPVFETYESLNGYPHSSKLNAKWKTSVVLNNRVYIGNIKRQQKSTFDGGGTWDSDEDNDPTYQDRICFSPTFKFDTFPEENEFIPGDDDDGDEIIKLETFADRLLVFKKNTLYILNVGGAVSDHAVEATYKNLGLDFKQTSSKNGFPCQSCKTDFGIAWMNSGGVYIYDGKQVQSLTDNKIRNMWIGEDGHEPFWADEDNDVPAIGYDPKSKKIICSKTMHYNGSDEEHLLIYDLKTKAWTYAENALTDGVDKTNFVVYKNELIWIEDVSAGSIGGINLHAKYWNDAPSDKTDIEIFTKDIDFGAPAVRKKVYKVYISYKGDASSLLVKYGINGETDVTTESDGKLAVDLKQFNSTDNPLEDKNATEDLESWTLAELKPTTSSEANDIYSFRLYISGTADSTFEINDITIIYRVKSIK